MRYLLIVWCVLFSFGASADTVKIATWNLGGFYKIPNHKLERIVKGLVILDADILVLPEINPLRHVRTIASKIKEANDSCYKWFAPDHPRAAQEIAILYKCD